MKHTIFLLILAAVISGCHTVHGVGQDVSAGGESIQSAAD